MHLHLLLTNDIAQSKPDTCRIIVEYGFIQVVFEDNEIRSGIHCIVEDTQSNMLNWLKPHGEFIRGNGHPKFEQFSKVRIRSSLC